jgi:ankyrin repeat protein
MNTVDLELIEAVREGDLARARAAISSGADVNVHDSRPLLGAGNTPLHDAANGGQSHLVRMLLDAGADVNARCAAGWTPLMRACNAGELAVVKTLLDEGADPHLRNAEGYTAYGRVPGTSTELLEYLKARGAANRHSG